MSENLNNENKMVDESNPSPEKEKATDNVSHKNNLPFFKNKKVIIPLVAVLCFAFLFVYSAVLIGVTVKIDRKIIAEQTGDTSIHEGSTSSNEIKDNTNETEKKTANDNKEKKIQLNQTVTIGNVMELTLESSEWLDVLLPSNTSGAYSYYDDKEGEKFFVVKGKVKSLANEAFDVSHTHQSHILINGTYKADVEMETEESDGTSFYGTLKPLQTLDVVIYASVSDEVYNICDDIVLTMEIVNDVEDATGYYINGKPHGTYTIKFDNPKK